MSSYPLIGYMLVTTTLHSLVCIRLVSTNPRNSWDGAALALWFLLYCWGVCLLWGVF